MNQKNKSNLKILKKISKESGLEEFWLGGSVPYHDIVKNLGVNFSIKDYDLAIKGGQKEYDAIKQKLEKNNFKIIKSRPYFLKFKKVFQIVAKKGAIDLDIAIVKRLSYLGHFNWECIFWHFPSGKVYDPYNSLNAIKEKKLVLTIFPKKENPFILTSRFAKICARFDIDISEDKKLLSLAKTLGRLMKTWKATDSFHGKYAKEHAYFGILEAISRSKNKEEFIKMLQKSTILASIFPEIGEKLKESDNSIKRIRNAKNPKDVANFFRYLVRRDKKKLKKLNQKIASISDRLNKD